MCRAPAPIPYSRSIGTYGASKSREMTSLKAVAARCLTAQSLPTLSQPISALRGANDRARVTATTQRRARCAGSSAARPRELRRDDGCSSARTGVRPLHDLVVFELLPTGDGWAYLRPTSQLALGREHTLSCRLACMSCHYLPKCGRCRPTATI